MPDFILVDVRVGGSRMLPEQRSLDTSMAVSAA
jgi:hypothetical protein